MYLVNQEQENGISSMSGWAHVFALFESPSLTCKIIISLISFGISDFFVTSDLPLVCDLGSFLADH